MTISELGTQAKQGKWLDEDGKPIELKFGPGLNESQIQSIEQNLGAKVPTDYRETLLQCAGIDGLVCEVDFTGESFSVGLEDLMPRGLAFAHDWCGNHWCVDLLATQESKSVIYFLCHDPAEFTYAYNGIDSFLDDAVKCSRGRPSVMGEPGHEADPNRPYPVPISHAEAMEGDPVLHSFAQDLDPKLFFLDLRNAPLGSSLSLMTFGPQTEVIRHPDARIFAFEQVEKKKGFLSRLFGR